MKGIRAKTAVVLATLAVACAGAHAQSQAMDPAVLQAAIEEASARLKLTPEQEAHIKPLMQERNDALKAIRDRYAGDDSRRARRAMFKAAQPVVENYLARVRTILADAQVAEWEKMGAEARERLKEQNNKGGAPE